MKTRFSFRACAVLLLAVGALALGGCGRGGDEQVSTDFPPKLSHRAVLKPVKAGEKIRYVDYAVDGTTRLGAQIEYIDGKTAYITYRKNGTIAEARLKYPAPKDNPEATRVTARVLKLDTDGHTYLLQEEYRADGTLARKGTRLTADSFEAFDYAADGQMVSKHELFALKDKTWKRSLVEGFRSDGTLETLGVLLADDSMETKTFAVDGSIASKAVLDKLGNNLTTEFYWAGTTTLRKKTIQLGYQVTVETYRANGVIAERRVFGSSYSSMTVTVFDSKGTAKFQQTWAATDDAPKDVTNPDTTARKYKLTEVDDLRADGTTAAVTYLQDDGKTPKSKKIAAPGAKYMYSDNTERTYRADGTLEKVEVRKDYKVVSSQTHTAAENIREPVEPRKLEPRSYDAPPPMLKTNYPYSGYPGGYDDYD